MYIKYSNPIVKNKNYVHITRKKRVYLVFLVTLPRVPAAATPKKSNPRPPLPGRARRIIKKHGEK